MYSIKHSAIALFRLTFLFGAIALINPQTGFGQKPAPPTTSPSPHPVNVLVTNTPLPVTGTITGSVSVANTLSVNVANTPTVKLDPNANEVTVAPRANTLLFDSGVVTSPDGSNLTTFGPINMSAYSKIRVGVTTRNGGEISVHIHSQVPLTGGEQYIQDHSFRLDFFDLAKFSDRTSVYEVPGRTLIFRIVTNEATTYRVMVFGN